MHKSFIISEEERKRILGIHENATRTQYLNIITEQTEEVPSDEVANNDAKTTFLPCQCITKKGWKRGVTPNNGYVYYIDENKTRYFTKPDGFCYFLEKGSRISYVYTECYETPTDEVIKFDKEKFFTKCPCVPQRNWKRGVYAEVTGSVYYDNPNGKETYYGESENDIFEGCSKSIIKGNEVVSQTDFKCSQWKKPASSETQLLQGKSVLTKGNKSKLVVTLNNALVKAGKLSADKQNSDVFDTATKQAVIAYQKENKDSDGKQLKPDGIVGKRTWSSMMTNGLVPTSGVSDVAVQKSAERVFGGELEKTMKSSPLFTQDFSKSNAEKIATVKGEIPNTNVDKGQAQIEKPKEQEPSSSAGMKPF